MEEKEIATSAFDKKETLLRNQLDELASKSKQASRQANDHFEDIIKNLQNQLSSKTVRLFFYGCFYEPSTLFKSTLVHNFPLTSFRL